MNPESISSELRKRIEAIEELLTDTSKKVNGVSIDVQRKLNGNVKIPPGIACKVAYDANGLIINGYVLKASDIPPLPIDSIEGLRKALDNLTSMGSDNNYEPVYEKGDIVGTGIKVNYDEHGWIVSSADLFVDDIPELPISHIKQLQEELDIIKSSIPSTSIIQKESPTVAPGCFPKITFDEHGKVVSGSKLTLDDIPMELITKINSIEEKIPGFASRSTVEALSKDIHNKVDGNRRMSPGMYAKVYVDSKGLVIDGQPLTIKDLPEININDIIDLSTTLRNKADQKDLMDLNDSVSAIVSSLGKIGDVTSIQHSLVMKADDNDVKMLKVKVNSLQNLMDTLSNKIPNELIMEQLQQIQNDISTISGRLSVLEKKMGINE